MTMLSRNGYSTQCMTTSSHFNLSLSSSANTPICNNAFHSRQQKEIYYERALIFTYGARICRIQGSFAVGDDDFILICHHEWVAWIPMGLFALGDNHKMQYNDIVMHWVLYPFHHQVVV